MTCVRAARRSLAPKLRAYFELLGARSWFGHRVALDFLLLSAGAIAELLHGDYAEAARGAAAGGITVATERRPRPSTAAACRHDRA